MGEMRVRRHADLTAAEVRALGHLFDSEYLREFGSWNPERPYGYSPADFHTLVYQGAELVAHVGFQRRMIAVGNEQVLVAGTGGVLVDPRARGNGLGRHAMMAAQRVMLDEAKVDFGYLGCREEVVPFYESAGWTRVSVVERSVSRADQTTLSVSRGSPILICSALRPADEWPKGGIDLRGTPW